MRRSAARLGLAVVLVMTVTGVPLPANGPESYGTGAGRRMPRFMITVGGEWLEVHKMEGNTEPRLIDSVGSPSPSVGAAREIVAGPRGVFVVAGSRDEPCESLLYRFRLAGNGHAGGITPVKGGDTAAQVAGLAISPDGRRIAFATLPCADSPTPRASLTVLDLATGRRRTWATNDASIIGEIVWARDSRTLGYAIGEVRGDNVGGVTVRALDTEAPGADLVAGRVLFRPSDGSGTVSSAVMNADGRTGYGMMRKGEPPQTILFSFAEGRPLNMTKLIPSEQTSGVIVLTSEGDEPRHACLNGLDAFGRVNDGTFTARLQDGRPCGVAWGY